MIKIGKPYITKDNEKATLNCFVKIDDKEDNIWFKVDLKFSDYLCHERADAYLIAVLDYAMRHGHDINVDAPVTESLLYNIETILLPALKENNPNIHIPHISAPTDNSQLPCAGAVATGISCGVDSLHTLAEQELYPFEGFKITHLTFNNVGSHGEGERAKRLFEQRITRSRRFSEEYGYTFVTGDSNLMDVIIQSHFKTHTYSSMFAVYCLQKLYSTYFYSSAGYKFNELDLDIENPHNCSGTYELLLLSVLSTPQLRIYSSGMGKSRFDKISEVIHYEPSYKYLNVCIMEDENCGHCEKCVRTMLGLDAARALDKYSLVFDTQYYKTHRKEYINKLYLFANDGDHPHDHIEMLPFFKKDITIRVRFNYFKYLIHKKAKIANRKTKDIVKTTLPFLTPVYAKFLSIATPPTETVDYQRIIKYLQQ